MIQSDLYNEMFSLTNSNATDYPEADRVRHLNDAQSDIWTRIKVARGVLEYDDRNYTDLPSATFNLTAGTKAYKITQDEDSNQIITIHKVAVQDANGEWIDVPRKIVGEGSQDGLTTSDTARVPTSYYEVGLSIVFAETPDTSMTNGVKIWFDRAPSYLASGGTTAVPGIPVIYHMLLAQKAALIYAVSKGLDSAANILRLIEIGENRLDEYEGNRRDDEIGRLTPYISDPT